MIKKELLALLFIDIIVIITEIIVTYIIWLWISNEILAIISLLSIPLIFPILVFALGYKYFKSKKYVWINRRQISVLALILNFMATYHAAVYISFWFQIKILHLPWQ
ncbi:MAG: hypothetical protein LBL65_06890 [Campylobacteraceae bacterium]|jgi:NhaP-type Na+/H+ or K+/H+ antiporter|nr:hypothetical protein [Campylobacteraceae bacterium]